jgi:4-hydroxy-tetrahydrodipicolinate reductase
VTQARFAVNGAKGRMGQAVVSLLDMQGVNITAQFEKDEPINLSFVDVIIDFSSPVASLAMLAACAQEGQNRDKPLVHVIGTTGFGDVELQKLEGYSRSVSIVKSGNFSLGVNMLLGLVKLAAKSLPAKDWDIEIFEAHHRHKVDAPSGTALMLGHACANGRERRLDDIRLKPRDGLTGARLEGAIGFSSLRGGGILGEHSVIFAAQEEVLTLSHSALDRGLFARGALTAALWATTKPAGLYDMQDVLDL